MQQKNQAKLRVGQPKVEVVNQCRTAVKGNNVQKLFKIINGDYDTAVPEKGSSSSSSSKRGGGGDGK